MTRKTARTIAGISFGCAALAQAANAWALVAFPGAEGFGANSVGGRGGDVYHVTTLANDPNHVIQGSFFYGVYTKNVPGSGTIPGVGRTIVFDVGGTLDLGATSFDLKDVHNITIAGQTAPSPVTIINNTFQITGNTAAKPTHDITMQYLTFRKGTGAGDDAMHVQGSADTHDIMVDHVSGSWSLDEVISVTQSAHHVTIQNSIMSEALTSDHAFGALIRPDNDSHVSYNHNLFSNQKSRNPRPGTYHTHTLDFEFQNNLIYNWSDRAGYIAGADTDVQHLNMNYIGNYLIAGPSAVDTNANTPRRETAFIKENNTNPLDVHVWQQGNKIDSNTTPAADGTDTGWGMFQNLNGTVYSAWSESDKAASAFAYPTTGSADSADVAYGKAIASVGAFPWARSDTDKRLVNDVLNYTGTAPITAPPTAEWNAIVAAPTVTRPAGFDTDQDGMPNAWEIQHGFNPNVANNNVFEADGYTQLEKYLQSLTKIANWNADANGNWSDYLNWRGDRPEAADSTANFIAPLTAPRVINVDIPVSVGQMKFDAAMPYTLAGSSGITLDVFAGSATIDIASGSHAIFAPVTFADNTIVTAAAGSGITIGNLQPAAVTLTKSGAGGLAVNNLRLTGLTIGGGTVVIIPDGTAAGVSKVTNLVASAGVLDITNNRLVTATAAGSFNGSVYTGVTGMVQSGRGNGTWNGSSGIITSQSDATTSSLTSIAVARASEIGITSTGVWAGQTVSSTDTLVMYTYAGDANLDGKINIDDYTRVDNGLANAAAGWSNGDFNYDGKVNIDDYVIIDNNIANQGPALFAAGGASASGVSAIPEPASIVGVAFSAIATLGIRRRRKC